MYLFELKTVDIESQLRKTRKERIRNFTDNPTPSPFGTINSEIMTNIASAISADVSFQSLPRRFFRVVNLVLGEAPDFAAENNNRLRFITTVQASRHRLGYNEYRDPESQIRLQRSLTTDLLNSENRMFLDTLNAQQNERINIIKTNSYLTETELFNLISTGVANFSSHGLMCNTMLVNPSLLPNSSYESLRAFTVTIVADHNIPTNRAYFLADPQTTGVMAIRVGISLETMHAVNEFATEYAAWEDIGMGILNTHSLITVDFNN